MPNTQEQRAQMLEALGLSSVEDLFSCIPETVRFKGKLNLPEALSEMELVSHMQALADSDLNLDACACFLGAGAYDHYVPAAIDQILLRQEFYTSYTPYQPEISQGTLQALFEYQTMICDIAGMDVSNASMYDGASALAEASIMACSITGRSRVLVARSIHPESRQAVRTYVTFRDMEVEEFGYVDGQANLEELEEKISPDTAAVLVQNPNFFGVVEPLEAIAEIAYRHGALFVASVDPISLALLKSPGESGADIAVGSGQPLGNPISFGGPHFGFLAVKERFVRRMPGRIVGQTHDKSGKRGFVLTLQAREQHIRREKATSNICTNHTLNAIAAAIYLSLMGRDGLVKVAELCQKKARYAYEALTGLGKFKPAFSAPFFREFVLLSAEPVGDLNRRLLDEKVIGGYPLGKDYPEMPDGWLLAVTEKRSREEIDRLVRVAGGASS